MPIDRFYIGPYDSDSGLQNDVKPFVLPEKSFQLLNNAYCWRGRIRKRFGTRWLGQTQQTTRLRMDLGNYSIDLAGGVGIGITDPDTGNASGTVPGPLYQVGQRFVIGVETDTVTNPALGPQPMTSTGPSIVHTFDLNNGNYVFTAAPLNTQILFYPNPLVTSVAGSISGIAPFPAVGQMFSIGSVIFTVAALGNPTTLLIANGSATTATFDTTTGEYIFVGVLDSMGSPVAGAQVFFYPSLPVMGMATLQNALIDNEPLIAFDTRFAYQYNNGWDRLGTGAAATWTGNNSQFFWFTTWTGVTANQYFLFVTNFNQNEPQFMRYFDGTNWNSFDPIVSLANSITMPCALLLIPFKNRLLAFNVWESTSGGPPVKYANRLRWTTIGSPIDDSGASPAYYPWNSDDGGIGGGLDCPTQQAIVTVEYIKDRLIVGMESSHWEIVYTGNEIDPFKWQQINSELGTESTFSVVPFDKVILSIGDVGIVACTGANVDRIDAKIPDEVFKIQNVNSGIERVYGIRDYFSEMTYWTFPDDSFSSIFPYMKRVLVYNYKNGTWAFNDDSFTVFGYFQPQAGDGILWSDQTILWSSQEYWDDGSIDSIFRQVAAGNQQGWTFIVDTENTLNEAALQITNIVISADVITITSIDYNMNDEDYVYLSGITGTGNISSLNGLIFRIAIIINNPNQFIIDFAGITGTYSGGGTIARVSNIQLLTKQYNFYLEQGRNFYVSRVDFLVDNTGPQGGQIEVDYEVNTSRLSMIDASQPLPDGTGSLLGTSILETTPYPDVALEQTSEQLWHPLYFQADGQFIQLNIQLNSEQMENVAVMEADFQLHALIFWTQKTSQWLR